MSSSIDCRPSATPSRLPHLRIAGIFPLISTLLLFGLTTAPLPANWLGFPVYQGTTAQGAFELVAEDFNEDGVIDFAVACSNQNLCIILGESRANVQYGAFEPTVYYPINNFATGITSGDFNGDTIIDLAVISQTANEVSILLGNGAGGVGNGTFATPVDYAVGSSPQDVITGDYNEDGITDLAVANNGSGSVSILLGNGTGGIGDGTFATAASYTSGSNSIGLAAGDFNGDDIIDLAVGRASGLISIMLGGGTAGVGDGAFSLFIVHSAASSVLNLVTADFNEDGILDLAAGSRSTDNLSVLLGNGTGGVGNGTFATAVNYAAGDDPIDIAAVDFNEDGIMDLAAVNQFSETISVFLGQGTGGVGDGTFAAAVAYPAGSGPVSLEAGDFNLDGITDFAVTHLNSFTMSVLLGGGSGGVGDGTIVTGSNFASGGSRPEAIATGDFNEDGIVDLAVTNQVGDNVSIYLGNGSMGEGDGTFGTSVEYAVGDRPMGIVAADFDEDGITDLAVSNLNSSNFSVLLGNGTAGIGDGTFATAVNYSIGLNLRHVATGDFDGDGILDLATVNEFSDAITLLYGDGAAGVGDGTFASANYFFTGDGPYSLAVGDFNEDGILDLAVTAVFDASVLIHLGSSFMGQADGYLEDGVVYATPTAPSFVSTADFNEDGILDLVVSAADTISILLGNGTAGVGDGTFAARVDYPTDGSPSRTIVTDFNNDGILDIAAMFSGIESYGILLGNGTGGVGDGTFAYPLHYGLGEAPAQFAAADFNADGLTDIVAAISIRERLQVNLNLGFAPLNSDMIWVDFNWTGTEQGTESLPFNTLAEGVAHLNPGGTLFIKPGSSSETPILSTLMRIEAPSGGVTIGQPIAP